ncbi:MAG: TIM barrel protein [Clostridia bacterium]|nr:TIM barrel protein [Clostridia bacterium]
MRLYMIPDASRLEDSLALSASEDLGFEYNDFFDPELLDYPAALDQRVRLYERLNRRGDTLHGAFYDIVIDSTDPEIRKISERRVRQSLEIAQRLCCRAVVFHTNYVVWMARNPAYRQRWTEMCASAYRRFADAYPELNIYIENMFDDAPDMLASLMIQTDHERVSVCLDVAHAALSPVPLETWFEKLRPYIRHLHLNDNDLVFDSHETIGQGRIDYRKVFAQISKLPGDTTALIEISDLQKTADSIRYIREGYNLGHSSS